MVMHETQRERSSVDATRSGTCSATQQTATLSGWRQTAVGMFSVPEGTAVKQSIFLKSLRQGHGGLLSSNMFSEAPYLEGKHLSKPYQERT